VPSNEQRREAAKRKLERQLARRAERAKRRRLIGVVSTVAVVVVAVGGIYFLTTQGHGDSSAAATPTSSPSTSPSAAAQTTGGPCKYAQTPGEPAAKPVDLPTDPSPTPNQGTVAVTLKTEQGDIPITLDRAEAPCTVQSFVHLAQAKFYDGSPCHRLTTKDPLKVLQCGDPTGKGTGGPGFTIKDEKPTNLKPAAGGQASTYPRGVLAMANTGQPHSGGSQFFMVYADSTLPPDYTVFGTIAPEGLQVIDKIAAAGDDGSFDSSAGGGKPKLPVTIQQAVVAS
jgi:peptidyl-prolyl cis-trans isomerase B (cyclophilin B)